jgi:hypothetical protein
MINDFTYLLYYLRIIRYFQFLGQKYRYVPQATLFKLQYILHKQHFDLHNIVQCFSYVTLFKGIILIQIIVNLILLLQLPPSLNFHNWGYEDVVYIFKLQFTSDRDVILKRLKNGNRQSKMAGYVFDEIPNLVIEVRKKDERILKNNLKELRVEFKGCWEHLNVDQTPSVLEETTAEDIYQICYRHYHRLI